MSGNSIPFSAFAGRIFLAASTSFCQWPPEVADPKPLNTTACSDSVFDTLDSAPVATDGHGLWVAVWGSEAVPGGTGAEGDCWYAWSTNNGQDWTAPVSLNTNPDLNVGKHWAPCIATDGLGHWVAAWLSAEDIYSERLGGQIGADWDVLFATGTGTTWGPPDALNTRAVIDNNQEWANEWGPYVATNGVGTWIAVWPSRDKLDGELGEMLDWDVVYSRSFDNGQTWARPRGLNTNAATDGGSDTGGPNLAGDGTGTWVAVWGTDDDLGGTIGGDADVVFSCSTDDGETWSAPAPIATDAASDTTEEWGARVATDGNGNWLVVWQSDIPPYYTIFVARSTDCMHWTGHRVLAERSHMPHITTDRRGTWVASWSGETPATEQEPDVWFARSTDLGVTWTAPTPLNTDAYSDTRDQVLPALATDGHGYWVGLWRSEYPLSCPGGGDTGTDGDVFVARFGLAVIPTVSGWGVLVMTLLLLAAGTIVVQSRRMHKQVPY